MFSMSWLIKYVLIIKADLDEQQNAMLLLTLVSSLSSGARRKKKDNIAEAFSRDHLLHSLR